MLSVLKIVKYYLFDFYLGRPVRKIAKKSLHYWITNRKTIGSNKSVTNRYLRGGGQIGGASENLNLQPTKKIV